MVGVRRRTLGAREDEIARLRSEVDALEARLTTLKDTQDQLSAGNDIRAFNANVAVYNGLVDRYNGRVATLNALVEEYNGLLGG